MTSLNELHRDGSTMPEEEWCGVCPKCRAVKNFKTVEYEYWSCVWPVLPISVVLSIAIPWFFLFPFISAAITSSQPLGYICRSCGHFTRVIERRSTY